MRRGHERARPRPPRTVRIITALAFLMLFIPLVSMVAGSFMVPVAGPGGPRVFGWDHYAAAFANEALMEALGLSLVIAAGATALATVIGSLGAIALERYRFPGRDWLAGLTLLPLVMPELVLGLSLLIWFVFLRLTLGTVSIVLAHTTFCLSYVIVIVRTRLRDFDVSLEEAARDLGATPWQVFRTVTLPLLAPGIGAAGLMAFTLSFDDFLITYFTAGVGSDTLPLKIYSLIKSGLNPELDALASLLLGVTAVTVAIVFRPLPRLRRRS